MFLTPLNHIRLDVTFETLCESCALQVAQYDKLLCVCLCVSLQGKVSHCFSYNQAGAPPYSVCLKDLALHTCSSSHTYSKFMSSSYMCGCSYMEPPSSPPHPPLLHKASFLFEVRLVACYLRRFFFFFFFFLYLFGNQSISINSVTFCSHWDIAVWFWSCSLVLFRCVASVLVDWREKWSASAPWPHCGRGSFLCERTFPPVWLHPWLLSIHRHLQMWVLASVTLSAQ